MQEKILFTTNTNPDIARKLFKWEVFRKGKASVKRFADQEISILIEEDVEGKEVSVLGSTNPPAENLLELLILINTLKENGAEKVHALIPYWGYAKADRIKPKGATLSAKLMANALELAGVDSVSIVNIHSQIAQDYFKVPFTYLDSIPLLAKDFRDLDLTKVVVVSPDKGGVGRAENFAEVLGTKEVTYVYKNRPQFDEAKITEVNGDVKDKICIIVDDMAQSGGTLIENAKVLKQHGAIKVFIAVAHIVHTGGSIPKFDKDNNIDKVFFTNTIAYTKPLSEKFKTIDITDLFLIKTSV